MEPAPSPERRIHRGESLLALLYFVAYLGYLFLHRETEAGHWLTLVMVPFLLALLIRGGPLAQSLREALASVGLRRGNLRRGVGVALLLGASLSVLQLLLSRRADAVWELFRSGRAFLLLPLVFVLLLLTAGWTEEFFFRGFLQTRLTVLLRSRLWSVTATSVLFGAYHLPYAYLHPRWPSQGDWPAALAAAFGQAVPMGLVLGALYERTGRNLLAPVVVHALFNTLPAMTLIRLGSS